MSDDDSWDKNNTLRDQISGALLAYLKKDGVDSAVPVSRFVFNLADAVMAVVMPELDRLQFEADEARDKREELTTKLNQIEIAFQDTKTLAEKLRHSDDWAQNRLEAVMKIPKRGLNPNVDSDGFNLVMGYNMALDDVRRTIHALGEFGP